MGSKQRIVRTISRLRTFARRPEEGQDIVEYALILPFLLLLTFMIIEGGWLIFRYNTVANAAREGARAGIIPVSATCNQTCVQNKVVAAATALTTGLDPARLGTPRLHGCHGAGYRQLQRRPDHRVGNPGDGRHKLDCPLSLRHYAERIEKERSPCLGYVAFSGCYPASWSR
jgi:hypothetical protein